MQFLQRCVTRGRPAITATPVILTAAIAYAVALYPSPSLAAIDDATSILARARAVTGVARAGTSVIHYHAVEAAEQAYESDRSYPPFLSAMIVEEAWFDPTSSVERVTSRRTYVGSESSPSVVMTDAKRAFAVNKDAVEPLSIAALRARYLNPLAVIADWAGAADVRVGRPEPYRDYPRTVLVRPTPEGEQRLFVDPKTGFPVKLELVAKHYLWGQQRIEYVYSNWIRVAGVLIAGASFRLVDGKTDISRTLGNAELLARAAAPPMALPDHPERSADELPVFLQPLDLTTVAVGPNTYLLSNAGYTEAVTKVGDEVIVLEATQGEARVKKDAAAIARLFPGTHKVTVVVTDLAWPHIAGVRTWVANGATIVTHSAAREFLRSVIDRRWTLSPDLLEQRRKTAVVKLVGVTATSLAGGAISLHPIDGIGSEIALMAYIAADRFLWASDFLQPPSAFGLAYASEVVAAVRRDGLHPERAAAQHVALTPWSQIETSTAP